MSGYTKQYYDGHLGADYHNEQNWEPFFRNFAQRIQADIAPKTVLDIGCAFGYVVKYLRELGVEAWGIDTSSYAVSQADESIRPYLRVSSACDPLPEDMPQKYDLVLNIEVLEHLSMEDGETAIKRMCGYADTIIFSSTGDDFAEPSHINVQQPSYWVTKFAKQGFYRNLQYDLNYVSHYAMRLEKKQPSIADIVFDYEFFLQHQQMQKHDAFTSKIYFNMGSGESEENVQLLTGYASEPFHQRINIPTGCRSIRFDPMEGSGCLIWNLHAHSDSQLLAVVSHNGYSLDNALLFSTIDPQVYFDLPENCHWVELSAEITPIAQAGWLELCAAVEEQQHKILELQAAVDAQAHDLQSLTDDNAALSHEIEEYNKLVAYERDEKDALKREIQDYSNLVAHERGEAQKVADAYARTLNSTSWKVTKPMRFVMRGVKAVLRPFKKVFVSLKVNGLKTTLKKILYKLRRKPMPEMPAAAQTPSFSNKHKSPLEAVSGAPVDPIETVVVQGPVKRLNLVTDTIDSHSLLGGVATALIVATEFVNRYDYELRIITRNSDVNPRNYYNIMSISDIQPAKKISFYSDFERKQKAVDFKLEITAEDIFFATSWWSAQAISATTIRPEFFYIIQEVETFFYNYGGEHLLCSQMMENKNIDYIVNSHYLYEYFREHNPFITDHGCYFEPAFPEKLYHKNSFASKTKYKLFFYARPNNPRNLYTIGVYMLNRAVELGILNTDEWDVYCVGQNAPVIQFSNGKSSINLGQLSWTEYAKFLSDIDLGLCLMYTPHPSYPPFDVACSGGVVLTNKMMNKVDFPYCKNVIVADLEEKAFMKAFGDSIALAKDMQERKRNYETNTICRNWHNTLSETIEYMGGKVENV